MTARPTSLTVRLGLRLLVPGTGVLPVRADLHYKVTDPYAVQIGFHTGQETDREVVQWTFARQLLSQGVAAPAGEGDVQVWPSTSRGAPVVCLSLSSPTGRALFEVPHADLVQFLRQTYQTVPSGDESAYVDVDAELALLLWAEPGA